MVPGAEAPLGSFEAAELADDVELGLDRIASNDPTAGPGARGASRRPRLASDRRSLPMPRLEAPALAGRPLP